MKKNTLKEERAMFVNMDSFFYPIFDDSIDENQIVELLNVYNKEKEHITKLIEVSNLEPKYYNKDVFVSYLEAKVKIISAEIEIAKKLKYGY